MDTLVRRKYSLTFFFVTLHCREPDTFDLFIYLLKCIRGFILIGVIRSYSSETNQTI